MNQKLLLTLSIIMVFAVSGNAIASSEFGATAASASTANKLSTTTNTTAPDQATDTSEGFLTSGGSKPTFSTTTSAGNEKDLKRAAKDQLQYLTSSGMIDYNVLVHFKCLAMNVDPSLPGNHPLWKSLLTGATELDKVITGLEKHKDRLLKELTAAKEKNKKLETQMKDASSHAYEGTHTAAAPPPYSGKEGEPLNTDGLETGAEGSTTSSQPSSAAK